MWYACCAWLLAIGASCFVLAPIGGGATQSSWLAAAPSLALCLRRENIKLYCWAFGSVITIYAYMLIVQMHMAGLLYSNYNLGTRYAWPLLDPNNAAAVINIALIPSIYLAMFKHYRWRVLSLFLAYALYATGSKAGIGVAGLSLIVLATVRYGAGIFFASVAGLLAGIAGTFYYRPGALVELAEALQSRFPIWESTYLLLGLRWWGGLGIGSFRYWYDKIRIEHYTGGSYAHNDLMQMAVEMGFPCAAVFVALLITVLFTWRRSNLVSGLVVAAIALMSMLEMQFYVPSVSYALGLVFAYHILNNQRGFKRLDSGV